MKIGQAFMREEIRKHFHHDGPFVRPDWGALSTFIEQHVPREEQNQAWDDAVELWTAALAENLGGDYRLTKSQRFICLSDRDEATTQWMVRFAERAEQKIRGVLRELAWGREHKHVFLALTDEDDYDSYVSQFYSEGTFATSIGVQIRTGLPHIVLHFIEAREALTTLAHELSHACVSHLPMPNWLDEGVAVTLQRFIGDVPPPESLSTVQAVWNIQSGWTPPVLWDELADRHHAFWNEQTIQSFWAGTSFFEPGDASELSYSLAEILLHLIAQDYGNWLDFLARAHRDDAGQTAALDCFGLGLGEVAGTFLGEGDWRPVRQEIVSCWEAAGWSKQG